MPIVVEISRSISLSCESITLIVKISPIVESCGWSVWVRGESFETSRKSWSWIELWTLSEIIDGVDGICLSRVGSESWVVRFD